MLQSIRERAQGVVAWFIVVLISVPFALFGINEYLGGGSEPVVASVNGQDITEREFDIGYREFRQNLRQRLGKDYRPDLIDEAVLRKDVLNAMIRNTLIAQASDAFGLRVGDTAVREAIVAIRAFQVGGQFNQQAYESGVRRQGLTPTAFEEQVRRSLVTQQIARAIRGSEFVTQAELDSLIRLRLQQRDLSYMVVPVGRFMDGLAVSEDEARQFYQANTKLYMAPERTRVEYLELKIGSIAQKLTADDASVAAYYENHKDEYMTAEQRRASHILFALDEGADDAAVAKARSAAQKALERLRAGEDFAALAKELSQDPASAEQGGDLGYFEKGSFGDKAIDEALAALQLDELSEPVRSAFGFHLFKLTAIRPPQGKSLDEAREQVKKAYLKSEAERLFYDYAEKLSNITYEDPDTLAPAAEELGLEIQESGWVTRDGGAGIFAAPKLVGAIYSDDVLNQGHNSEAIEIGPEHVVVLRVKEHEEAAVKPFAEVKEQIIASLKKQKGAEQAKARGLELIASLKNGKEMTQIAQEQQLTLIKQGYVDRGNRDLDPVILGQLFKLPKPAAGKPVYGYSQLPNGDVAVLALKGVKEGDKAQAEALGGEQGLRLALQRAKAESYYQAMLKNLRAEGDISITQK